MSTAPEPVVVLRSNDMLFTGILRSVAHGGGESFPFVFDWPGAPRWHSRHSRHYRNVTPFPNPFGEPERAAAVFAQEASSLAARLGTRPIALPSSDTNLMFMLDHEATFASAIRLMGDASFRSYRREVTLKHECMALLDAAGVAVPKSFQVTTVADIPNAVDGVQYPCVYKPIAKDYGQTFYRAHGGLKAISCTGPDELRTRLTTEIAAGFQLIVQDQLLFDSVRDEIPFYVCADERHRVRCAATAIKERIDPHPFGTATVLRLSYHPELLPIAEDLVKKIAWRGLLMIEFIRDQRDGRWKVVELNARPWLMIDFFRRSGVPFIGTLLDDLRGAGAAASGPVTPSAERLRAGAVHVDLVTAAEAQGIQHSLGAIEAWLRGIGGDLSFPFLDPDDPAPGVDRLRMASERWGVPFQQLMALVESVAGPR